MTFLLAGAGLAFSATSSRDVNISVDVVGEQDAAVAGGAGFPAVNPVPPQIFNVRVNGLAPNSANILCDTDVLAYCRVYWGQTTAYEAGNTAEISFGFEHTLSIANLLPNTTYHYKVACYNTSYVGAGTGDNIFTTPKKTATAEMPNVINLTAYSGNQSAALSWQKPPDEPDYAGVYILRSTVFYPQSITSGILVYRGTGIWSSGMNKYLFTDTGLKNGLTYYYTVFAYDKNGRVASGAIISATPHPPVKVIEPPAGETTTLWRPVSEKGENLPSASGTPPGALVLKDFDFVQEDRTLAVKNNSVSALVDAPIYMTLKNFKVPAAARSATVTFTEAQKNKKFGFIFKGKSNSDIITGVYFLPDDDGKYDVSVLFYDYRNRPIQQVTGTVLLQPLAEQASYKQTVIRAGGCPVPKLIARTLDNHPKLLAYYQIICPWWPLTIVVIFVGGALLLWWLMARRLHF